MKISRKIIALFMTMTIIVSTFFCFSVNSFAEYEGKVPIIFVRGQGSTLVIENEDGSTQSVSFNIDTSKVLNIALENKDMFIKAFFTQDWSDFSKLISGILTDSFKECKLDEAGEPTDGSKSHFSPTIEYVEKRYKNGTYGLETFYFDYDWRLDPYENMDELESYIDLVLEVTGSEKYALCGRCEGSCLVLQYLEYYKEKHNGQYDERITDVVMYSSAALGASPMGEAFTGKLYLDTDALERFVYDNDFGFNKDLGLFTLTDESFREIITIFSNAYGLDLACWAVNNVYQQIYLSIIPEGLKNSYASFPGYWAMVSDKFYEDAKQTMFGGQEEKYATFIQKIDNYHYNIQNRSEEILKEAQSHGIEVSNIVKYGLQIYPVVENCDTQSDQICDVYSAGWGVTSTNLGETFSTDYIKDAIKKGTVKYISPDNCIDASTTWLKDTTWFIKNLQHKKFPNSADPLVFIIVNTENITVDTYKDYPQYLYYDTDNDVIIPYDVENHKVKLDNYFSDPAVSFARKIKPAFKYFFKALTFIINILMPSVKS